MGSQACCGKTKALWSFIILAFLRGQVLAFSTHTKSLSFTNVLNLPVRGPPALYVVEGNEEKVNEDKVDPPRPPNYFPRVDEQLALDLRESERRIMLYEKEIEMVREQLNLKQDELIEERNMFRDEKTSLMTKISEFTNMLSKRDEELAEMETVKIKEKELEKQIKALEDQLAFKTNSYLKEKKASDEIRKLYIEAQDALEFEQMEFEKQKKSLLEAVGSERQNIKILEEKLKEAKTAFENMQRELMEKIKSEETKLRNTKVSWQDAQNALKETQEKLREALSEKQDILKESKKELSSERDKFSLEREELKKRIDDEQSIVKDLQHELRDTQRRFEKSKNQLESAIKDEQKNVERLKEEMASERRKFDEDREALEIRIQKESERLARLEDQLADERITFSKEREKLEFKLSEEIRIGKLKKRQMNDRFNDIRKEMTALWEGSKREARKEEARLTKKYQNILDDAKQRMTQLEVDLQESGKTVDELRVLLDETELQKKRLLIEQRAIERKFQDNLAEKDVVIKVLQKDKEGLQRIIDDKDGIIREQGEKIDKYETSFRAVARLSLQVTGGKIKKVGHSLKRLIQNHPPPED